MAILVKDSFDRANSTAGLGQAETGQTWQTFGSVWGIQNNLAYPVNATIMTPPYVISPKIDNVSFQIKLTITNSDNIIVYKMDNESNLYGLDRGGAFKISSGAITILASIPSFNNNDVVKVTIINNIHTIYFNNVQVASFSDSSVQGDKFGFSSYGSATVRYDDFLIEDLSAPIGTTHTKTLNETVSISENVIKTLSSFKMFSESISTSDTIYKRLSVMVADAIATSEIGNENVSKGVNDDLSIADDTSITANKVVLDNINFEESISERIERILSDFIPIDDVISVSNSNTRSINLSDSIAILDSISKSLSRSISDNVDLGDADEHSTTKSLIDNIAIADSFSNFGGKSILLTDSISMTDSISSTKRLSRFLTESVGLSDTFTKQSAQIIKLYDVIVTDDEIDVFNPDVPELVGVIHLQGKRELYVYLQGKRDLIVNLQGKRELTIHLKGGLNMISNQNFSMISGDTKTIVININENLVGVTAIWSMKKRGAPTVTLIKQGTIVDGKIHIVLDKVDTEELSGLFVHECEVTDQSGNVSTVTSGSVNILADMI